MRSESVQPPNIQDNKFLKGTKLLKAEFSVDMKNRHNIKKLQKLDKNEKFDGKINLSFIDYIEGKKKPNPLVDPQNNYLYHQNFVQR